MNTEILQWLSDNYPIAIIIIIVTIIFIYNRVKKSKKKKLIKEEDIPVERNFDTVRLDEGFASTNDMADDELGYFKKVLKGIQEELTERRTQYKEAGERYKKILDLEKSLRNNIEILIKEEKLYKEKVEGLKKRGK